MSDLVIRGEPGWEIHQGDCLPLLKAMKSNSFHALVCDPPAGISFMGKGWDDDKGGREQWISWLSEVMAETMRVVMPGGHALVWALPRTSHWTGLALERAGWEIRDCLMHVFGSGFPKNLDIAKAIDKTLGAAREVVGEVRLNGHQKFEIDNGGWNDPNRTSYPIHGEAITPEAKEWDGWGTALKPGHESWWLCRKPLEASSIARQVLATGTGAINIDGSRVGQREQNIVRGGDPDRSAYGKFAHDDKIQEFHYSGGRWPTHTLLSHSADCVPEGERQVRGNKLEPHIASTDAPVYGYALSSRVGQVRSGSPHTDGDGFETVQSWRCAADCPVAEMDRQSGESESARTVRMKAGEERNRHGVYGSDIAKTDYVGGFNDQGGASRFFPTFHPFLYAAKPARSERDKGLSGTVATGGEATGRKEGSAALDSPRMGAGRNGGARNIHPTVKGEALMSWLVRLITPPGGIVLDCFLGSGSTGVAAIREGFKFVGIEMMPEYFAIAEARIREAAKVDPVNLPLFEAAKAGAQMLSLFDSEAV